MRVKRALLSALLCFGFFSASAQMEEPVGILTDNGFTRFISVGAGATYQSFRDEAISKTIYQGYSAAPVLRFVKNHDTKFSEVALQASRMNFTRDSDPLLEQKIKSWRASADYRYMQALPFWVEEEKNQFLLGGQLSGMFCYKNAPLMAGSSKVYEYAATLGPSARFVKKFEMKSKYHALSFDLSIPVLSFVARPSYLNRTSTLENNEIKASDVLSKARMGSFGRMFRLNTGISYMYMLDNGNAINIGYTWDYYQMNNQTQVYYASHTLSLQFMFNY
ncbi:MAG: hypothetical protein EOP51_10825 [Sphingobacteriales bacterium]|nr:MAG: hypothetical protein EOP51_10825 [Sphingobacteriales bacterium]